MNINKKLEKLYEEKWAGLKNAWNEYSGEAKQKLHKPLLMQLVDDFDNADIKVMFIEQELPKGTKYQIGESFPEFKIPGYQDLENDLKEAKGIASYFKKEFIKRFNNKHKDKKIQYVWNNLIKIGLADCKDKTLYSLEKKNFTVLKEEIEIIKPDVILFTTGPVYDNKLKYLIGVAPEKIDGFDKKQLAFIPMDHIVALRTYHPRSICRYCGGWDFIDRIIEQIEKGGLYGSLEM
ncbi:MAG: hypothetical protein LBR17_08085 [Bacteroidales bacterium]|nr:hypothetical protein [Bacteroidales bacterium]